MPGRSQARVTAESPRTERLQQRVSHETKELLQLAANLEGRSLSDFIISSARDVAQRRLVEERIIRLAVDDNRRLHETLLDPPEPNDRLIAAMRRYTAGSPSQNPTRRDDTVPDA